MKVLTTDIAPLWQTFLSGGTTVYEKIADEFQEAQPEIWKILKQVDQNSFNAKTDHVVAYGAFIWATITSHYGPKQRVARNVIDELQREEDTFLAGLEDEPDYFIKDAVAERRRLFPEPALAAHIEREFDEGSARAKELNPANNAVAVRCLLIMIKAVIVAPRR
jgi:hypothetical protein